MAQRQVWNDRAYFAKLPHTLDLLIEEFARSEQAGFQMRIFT